MFTIVIPNYVFLLPQKDAIRGRQIFVILNLRLMVNHVIRLVNASSRGRTNDHNYHINFALQTKKYDPGSQTVVTALQIKNVIQEVKLL